MEVIFSSLKTVAREFLATDSSGHNIDHAERVFNIAIKIQKQEGGDPLVIGTSAIVHDLCRPFEKETGQSHFGPEALNIIKKVLVEANVPADKLEDILLLVALHDTYDWQGEIEKTAELKVLQDADRLDAIGAIGIARTFMFGGAHGSILWKPGETLHFAEGFQEGRDASTTIIAHFYEKLLRLADNMNTETGKRMAEHRHAFMKLFLQEFFDEWEGNK